MNDYISIAKILNFHGIKGEVKVGFTKGHEAQLLACKKLTVKSNDNFSELNIQNIRFHKNFAIIKFKELNSINDTMNYKGLELFLQKNEVSKSLVEDEYLVSDLKGLEAYDTNDNYLGKTYEVGENNANDVISIKDQSGKIHLIPFVKELVPVVDIINRKIVINNIEGLIE